MALVGVSFSASIVVGVNAPIDAKYGPFASVATANSEVGSTLRYLGLTVGIITAGSIVEYWYKDGILDSDLILKTPSLIWANITGTPTTLSGYGITDAVPSSRTLTINGTAFDLTADRSWTVTASVPSLQQVTAVGNTTTLNIGCANLACTSISAVPVAGATFKVNGGYANGTPLMGLSYTKFSGFLSGTVGSIMFFDQSGWFSISGFPRSDWDNNTLGYGTGNSVLFCSIPDNLTSLSQPVRMFQTLLVDKDITSKNPIVYDTAQDLKHIIEVDSPSSSTFGAIFEMRKQKAGGAISNDLIGGLKWFGATAANTFSEAGAISMLGLSATWGTAANRSSYMTFRTRNADSYGERMRITNDGNVLIGTTTNGTFKMDVNGRVRIQNMLTLGSLASDPSGANGMIYYNTTTNKFRGYENGAWVNLI